MLDLTKRQKQALGGSLVLALGMVVGVVIAPDDPQRDDKLADLGSAIESGSALSESDKVDTAEYHRAMIEVRKDRPDVVDLLTAPVEPGATVAALVNLPPGMRLSAPVEYVGPSAGNFATVEIGYEDSSSDTLVKVTATNTSPMRVRLTALVQFAPAPADAGI